MAINDSWNLFQLQNVPLTFLRVTNDGLCILAPFPIALALGIDLLTPVGPRPFFAPECSVFCALNAIDRSLLLLSNDHPQASLTKPNGSWRFFPQSHNLS